MGAEITAKIIAPGRPGLRDAETTLRKQEIEGKGKARGPNGVGGHGRRPYPSAGACFTGSTIWNCVWIVSSEWAKILPP